MNNKFLKRTGALCFAAAMLLSCTLPAFAAPDDVADMSKTGSLTVYKYDITAAERALGELEAIEATGQRNEYAEELLQDYAIEGVEFSYLRIGDVVTYSENGSTELLYEIPGELMKLLGLTGEQAKDSREDAYYFNSENLNKALADQLTSGVEGKNALETYLSKSAAAKAMPETNADGFSKAEGLKTGFYLVVETRVPENIVETTDPFFVSIPSTDANGDYWYYDIVSYPKNQSGAPTLDKLVSENGTYDDTATASEGDTLSYSLVSHTPVITSRTTYLSEYVFTDQLSAGLEYNQDTSIALYALEEDAMNNDLDQAKEIWTAQENAGCFLVSYNEDGSEMTVALTAEGLGKINTAYSGYYLVVYYTATVHSDLTAVLGDKGNPNEVTLTYSRTNQNYYDTLEDECIIYTYGIQLKKEFSDGKGSAKKVQFILQNVSDDYYLCAKADEEQEGSYYVTGQAEHEEEATKFIPSQEGKLIIYGMEADSYLLTEIQTDEGYSLLREPVQIRISKTETSITPSAANITGTAGENSAAIKQEAPGKAFVNEKTAEMLSGTDSANAFVKMSVVNTKGFPLPNSGGTGVYLVTIAGVLCAAGGCLLTVTNPKKKQDDV